MNAIQIKHRLTGVVLFEGESGMTMRQALEQATTAKADLRFANLGSADLGSADLGGKKLVGNRPFFSIGPIGSRGDYIQTWITDYVLMISAGCFFGTKAEFESKLTDEHGDNVHGNEYRAALVIFDKHAELWTPVTTEKLGQSA